ncbi:MAG: hypothetical protein JO300_05860 [Silvibacterium sp.]|nr:hypothetical protein [Silvibacterium sp.]MBV8438592.1 hypothetical protein [Silvibacterium sp.]
MRTAAEWLPPVKASGITAYLIASAACALTAARVPGKRIARLAAVLCALDLAQLLDIAFALRWKIYDVLKSGALRHHWYAERAGPQVAALIVMAAVLLVSGVWLCRRFTSIRGAALAICGGLLSIGCWLAEIISLHATDVILYRRAGPLMVISFVWMLACAMTTAGMLMAGASSFRCVTKSRTNI